VVLFCVPLNDTISVAAAAVASTHLCSEQLESCCKRTPHSRRPSRLEIISEERSIGCATYILSAAAAIGPVRFAVAGELISCLCGSESDSIRAPRPASEFSRLAGQLKDRRNYLHVHTESSTQSRRRRLVSAGAYSRQTGRA
jgi:hypothetical protein